MNILLHTDQQLLAEIALGSHRATEAVYNKHHKPVIAWIVKRGGLEADAQDVYQEAMIVLYEKAQGEDFRLSCKIGTYLFAVSKHLWYKKLEQQKRNPAMPSAFEKEEESGDEQVYEADVNVHEEREMHFRQLSEAMEQLGEPCAALLKAFYHENKSMNDISASFGYTNTDTAKTQKYKCLNRLKKIFYNNTIR